jgi:uncharacterized membrane protein
VEKARKHKLAVQETVPTSKLPTVKRAKLPEEEASVRLSVHHLFYVSYLESENRILVEAQRYQFARYLRGAIIFRMPRSCPCCQSHCYGV